MGSIRPPVEMEEWMRGVQKRQDLDARRGPRLGLLFPYPYVIDDLDDLPPTDNIAEGAVKYVSALGVEFRALNGVWAQQGVAKVATTTARDDEYAKASGAYLTAWIECHVSADLVTYKRIGSNWAKWDKPWSAWTPSWTGFTVGASTVLAGYSIIKGLLAGTFRLTLGSGFAVGTSPRITWPETPHTNVLSPSHPVGQVNYRDVSTADTWIGPLSVYPTDLASMRLERSVQSGSYLAANMGAVTTWQAANPIASPASGDIMAGQFGYPVENAY